MFSSASSRASQPPPGGPPPSESMIIGETLGLLKANVEQLNERVGGLNQGLEGVKADVVRLKAQGVEPQCTKLCRSCGVTAALSAQTTAGYWARSLKAWVYGLPYIITGGCFLNCCRGIDPYPEAYRYMNNDAVVPRFEDKNCCHPDKDTIPQTCQTIGFAAESMCMMPVRAVTHSLTGGCCCNCCGQYDPLHLGVVR